VIETIGGKPLGVVLEGQKRFLIQARFAGDVRRDLERIRDLRVAAPAEEGSPRRLIPLSQLAAIAVEEGPAQISRDRHQPPDQRREQRPPAATSPRSSSRPRPPSSARSSSRPAGR